MNIKLSTFHSYLHESSAFDTSNANFIKSIEDILNDKLSLSELDDYACDLKLIFIESGGSEGLFLANFDKLKEPYYFLTSGSNNSLAASLEILTYLNQQGKKCEVIHGDVNYIAKRIKELAFINTVKEKLDINLGVIGKPSDWLISSVPDYNKIKEIFNINLIDIPLSEVEDNYNKLSLDLSLADEYDFSKEEVIKAKKVYNAIDKIVKNNNLSGLTIRCFDLLTSIKSTGCLSLALFNKDGITGTCEGDIMAMISMKIAEIVSGGSTFQANPSRIDVTNNEIIFAHCTIPFNMLESYKIDTHFESKSGMAIKGYLRKEDITVFRLSADLKNYFVSEGTILTNLEEADLCRTQIKVKMDEDVSTLLKHPCGNHHIVFYGRHKEKIDLLMKELYK